MASAGFGCVRVRAGHCAAHAGCAHPIAISACPLRGRRHLDEFWVGSGALNLKRDGSLALAILVGTATEFS